MFSKIEIELNKIITSVGIVIFIFLITSSAFAAIPTVGTVSPSSGSTAPDIAKAFIATYSDTDGWGSLKEAYLLISTSSSALANSVYLYYDQNTNLLYLRNDTNTAWLGGYNPGTFRVIENSQVRLNCILTTISGSSNTLTVNFNLTFKSAYSGKSYNTYLKVVDDSAGFAGWTKKGTHKVNYKPVVGTIIPTSGTGQTETPLTFTTTYSDQDGWQNIRYVGFLINTSTSGANCLYVRYNQNTNKLLIRNNANSSWLGGYSPGSSNVIENSYAKLYCATTTISGSGNTLTVNWQVTFKATFTGSKKTYLYVRDDPGAYQGYVQKGTWNIQGDVTPPTGTIKVNNDSQYTKSTSVTLNLSAADSGSGMGSGAQMQFSNDNIAWSVPEVYATTKTWTLVSGEGQKTVYVKYKDVTGNWSEVYSDTIILDTTPPAIYINSVLSPTNQNVILSYMVTDNFTPSGEIVITGDNSPYISEGSHNVTLTAQDKAGNSVSESISFTIDKTAPVVIITSPTNGQVFEDARVQITGTIDGISFSENRTLTEGENTLTKTASDAAGNTASALVSVYLYSGQLIGPEGGQVNSPDGMVKVIIPQGALSESTRIRILNISRETLQDATPGNKALLSAVECKPYGLIFNKLIEIIYTLYQAEVPGTPVELGFYDAVQDKILPTGQASAVPADGYTISFSVIHFSTYTALKNLTPQSTPIGVGVQIPLPDMLTGAFSHAIPISVVPGRKGIQPALAITYRSSNANSWVGQGFSLNPGYIVRSTRLGPPTYIDNQDTFYFITDAGTTELVNLINNLYQAKVESSFTKFFKESDDSWKAVAKDGSILRFGQTSDSKETSQQGTFAWYLTKAVDTNGNYVEYHYNKDQGKSYLSRIDYTGNEMGVSPANYIEFFLESRSDISSNYISSSRIVTAKRLKEIQVKQNYDLVWRYVLEYTYSPDTNRSLLKTITQYGSDNKSLPTQTLSYQQAK